LIQQAASIQSSFGVNKFFRQNQRHTFPGMTGLALGRLMRCKGVVSFLIPFNPVQDFHHMPARVSLFPAFEPGLHSEFVLGTATPRTVFHIDQMRKFRA
jgi:hypothetical protein